MTLSSHAGLDTLLTWIRTESPTHDVAGVNLMMDLVVTQMADAPVAIERLPGAHGLGDALILRAGPQRDEPAILVMSHLDTVHPVGTIDTDLPLRIEGDRLYGPGVYDMKAGAWFALEAFKDVARAGNAARPMVFIVTPDEEIGSPMTRPIIESIGRRSAFALVTEPARDGGKIVTSRKGVGRFDVHVEGRPAHAGSRHPDGRNAIYEAARQILAVEAMTDYSRGVTTTVGMISGGTAVNTIPQHCHFPIDLRVETVADGEVLDRRHHGVASREPGFQGHGDGRDEPSALRMQRRRRRVSSTTRSRSPPRSDSTSFHRPAQAAARTAISPPPSARRLSMASASTATARTPCRNMA